MKNNIIRCIVRLLTHSHQISTSDSLHLESSGSTNTEPGFVDCFHRQHLERISKDVETKIVPLVPEPYDAKIICMVPYLPQRA